MKKISTKTWQILFFVVVTGMTIYAVFSSSNLTEVWASVKQMPAGYMAAAIGFGLLFVCLEGFMIWYLLSSMNGTSRLYQCLAYSFIGFFYSGITPSATGGQPMQLYYMRRDGNDISSSTVVLMTVAVMYKLVLVILGLLILFFWNTPLRSFLHGYYYLYLLGIFLNVVLVAAILGVMIFPKAILKIIQWFQKIMIHFGFWKESPERDRKTMDFIEEYHQAVVFLNDHRGKVTVVLLLTFVQRISLFMVTWMVYLGSGLSGTDMLTVLILQASVYIAVDMLPLPGAQGITELMYQVVFSTIFTGAWLIPSMFVTRAVNFYFLLIFSLIIVIASRFIRSRNTRLKPDTMKSRDNI
ncbi:MAG: lysylphosphatidylglycerol synthase transmembrane domain-containing protein [Eubacteriaceae bacterium]|jgi:uncharacterized protein (TIRG00374 family)